MGRDTTDDGRNDLVSADTTGADIYVVARVETSGKTKRCLFPVSAAPNPNGYYVFPLSSETIDPSDSPSNDHSGQKAE